MTTLKVGDIRQKGDQVRAHYLYFANGIQRTKPGERVFEQWEFVHAHNRPILASDLMHAEYRRP